MNRTQMEQRIVNPELTDTAVTRRDVRAVPGGLQRAPKGGYSSNLEFSGDEFTATYVFDDPEVARIAATGGGERIMAWQEEDVDGNRQGLTISEFGELGGPGMGGCPAGPSDTGLPSVPAPGASAGGLGRVTLTWTASAPPITGYGVQLVDSATGAPVGGLRETTTSTTVTVYNLPAGSYAFTVRARNATATAGRPDSPHPSRSPRPTGSRSTTHAGGPTSCASAAPAPSRARA